MANIVPFPPVDFPQPVIREAERYPLIVLEDGRMICGYIRQRADDADARHPPNHSRFAYARCGTKSISLGPEGSRKGKVIYASAYQRSLGDDDSGRYRDTGDRVVIKKLSKAYIQRHPHDNPFNEIAVARSEMADNTHVISTYMHEDALEDEHFIYIITPFFGDDLFTALSSANDVQLIRTLARNLIHLQSYGVIHRDISLENIIFHEHRREECCPLIDFAMALRCVAVENQQMYITPQPRVGKREYMSPEIFQEQPFSFGVDVWAVGCICFILWTNQYLYDEIDDKSWNLFFGENCLQDEESAQRKLDWYDQHQPEDLPEEWGQPAQRLRSIQNLTPERRSLLKGMLTLNPSERLTATQILQHPYLNQG